jgi:hypothetical protein
MKEERCPWILPGVFGCLLSAALALHPAAAEQVTEGKFYSCLSTQWLDEFTAFAIRNDVQAMRSYLARKRCLLLKPDLPVILAEDADPFGPRAEFMIQGIRFYAPSEEITFR